METLILCNGLPPSRELFDRSRSWARYFIAADGGGNIARSFNTLPDVVVGDMDSFEPREDDSFETVCDSDQETNDLEKALALAEKRGARQVMVLGATGKRLDHTLKNLSVLKQFNKKFNSLWFRDDFGDTLLISKSYTADLAPGTPVSLFPLSGVVKGIRTKGLKYPLNKESLENGVRDGSSNEVTSGPVEISYERGDLILFIANG